MQEMNTLFVGDLSIFCEENDIQEMFVKYGELDEVKIIRCEETNKNLSYGFVKYSKHESAVLALKELNGVLLEGRPMRIGWAARKPNLSEANSFASCDNTIKDRSSIHIFYQTNQVDPIINEAYLLERFGKFGVIVDISIKRFELNQEHQFQKGYGFVHFPFTNSGLESALKCCEVFNDQMIDNVVYKCNISHRLKKSMNPNPTSYDQQNTIPSYEQSQYTEFMSPFPTIVNTPGNLGNYSYMIPSTQSPSMIPTNCMPPYYLPHMVYNPYYNNTTTNVATTCYGNFGLIPNIPGQQVAATFRYSNPLIPTPYPSQPMIYNPMLQHFLYSNSSNNSNNSNVMPTLPQQTCIDTNNNSIPVQQPNTNIITQETNLQQHQQQQPPSYWNQNNPYTANMMNNQVSNDPNTFIEIPHTANGRDGCYVQEHATNYHNNKQENNYISKNKTYERKFKKYSSNFVNNDYNKNHKSDYSSIHKLDPIITSTSSDHNNHHSLSDGNNSSLSSEENNSTDSEVNSAATAIIIESSNNNILEIDEIVSDQHYVFNIKHEIDKNTTINSHNIDTNHVIQKLNNLQIDNDDTNNSFNLVIETIETTPLLNTASTYMDDVVYK